MQQFLILLYLQLIFSGEYTKAMDKDWHSGHFCCWQCDESLTGQRYVIRDDHPYCIKCYENVFANTCEECNKIIGIDSKVSKIVKKNSLFHSLAFFIQLHICIFINAYFYKCIYALVCMRQVLFVKLEIVHKYRIITSFLQFIFDFN